MFVGLLNVPEILVWFEAAEPPVSPTETVGADHEYVVPTGTIADGGLFERVTVKIAPLQAVAVCAGINCTGFTVTTKVKVLLHVFGTVPDLAVTV